MREIKFRAWDTISKSYVHFNFTHIYSCGYEENEVNVCENRHEILLACQGENNPDVVVELFTGLKDKNGKDIYEGDIVYAEQWNPKRYEVIFDRGGFCLKYDDEGYYPDIKYAEAMEVIGNVHENKELLDGKVVR